MAVIGSLAVALTANTRGFNKGMKRGQSAIGGFATSVKSALGTVTAFAGGLAVLAGGAALGALVKNAYESIDATAKLADRLGATTEELTSLRHAAGLAGVGADGLDKSLETMVRRLGEAQQGTGEAARGLETLGLKASDLTGLSAGEQFIRIAEGVRQIEDPTLKAATAYQIFGRQGQQLINTLNTGEAGLRAAAEEADRLGLTFSRLDAARIELANDSITRMRSLVQGVAQTIAIETAPMLDALASKVVDVGTAGGGVSEKVVAGFEAVAKVIAFASDLLLPLKGAFHFMQAGASISLAAIVKGIDLVGQGLAALLNMLPGVEAEWSATMGMLANELVAAATEAGDKGAAAFVQLANGGNSAGVSAFFDDLRRRSTGAATAIAEASEAAAGLNAELGKAPAAGMAEGAEKMLAGLKDQLATLGMARREMELYRLEQAGATAQQIAQATSLLDQIGTRQKELDLLDEGRRLAESLKGPTEAFETQLSALTALYKAGEIGGAELDSLTDRLLERFDGGGTDGGGVDNFARSQFRQADLSRIALDGVERAGNRPQKIESKQLATLIELQKQANTKMGGPARAA